MRGGRARTASSMSLISDPVPVSDSDGRRFEAGRVCEDLIRAKSPLPAVNFDWYSTVDLSSNLAGSKIRRGTDGSFILAADISSWWQTT